MVGSTEYRGLPIAIDNPKGTLRTGVSKEGVAWSHEMTSDYGDLFNTVGADGDPIDVFLCNPVNTGGAFDYIINQNNPETGEFDEHKVMLGFATQSDAQYDYLQNYDSSFSGFGEIFPVDEGALNDWIKNGDKSKPYAPKVEQQAEQQAAVMDSKENLADAIMLGDGFYKMDDAAPGVISILASLANVRNQNNRFYTGEFLDAVAPIADAQCKSSPVYGEEPHPPYDSSRGGYVTDSTRECWKHLSWFTDAAHNLWTKVQVDSRTAKGARIAQKVKAKEKLGVSVRWQAERLGPKASLTDGSQVELYDKEMAQYVVPFALDAVPNPAFTQAGRYMTDSTDNAEEMLDATDPSKISADPLSNAVSGQDLAERQEAKPGADPDINASGEASHNHSQEDKPLADSKGLENTMPDEKKKDDAAQDAAVDAAKSVPVMDAAQIAAIVAEQLAQVQAVQAKKSEDKAQVINLADSIKDGSADGYDLARFTDKQRERIAARAAKSENLADARTLIESAIEDMDDMIASATVASIAGVETASKGSSAEGQAASVAEDRVAVVRDEADKKILEVQDGLNKAFDRADKRFGIHHDLRQRESNKESVDTIMAGVFGNGEIKNAEGNVGRRLIPNEVLADSARYVMSSGEAKKTYDRRPVLQAMIDAKMVSAIAMNDAVVNTTNVLTQPIISQIVMRKMYQDLEALQYCEGLGAQSFTGAAGGAGAIGRALKVMTAYITEPAHSMQGLRRGSLNVPEGSGIARSGLVSGWQQFHVSTRSLSFDRSKEVEMAMMHGAINFDLIAEQYAQNIALFARDTDSQLYLEHAAFSDEVGAIALGSAETVASGNLKNGVTQDGITYGSSVTCIAQADCGGAFSAALAARITDNSANASTSNAYRVPIVMPRVGTVVDTNGIESAVTTNPVVVKLGATVLVEGWLDRDYNIQTIPGAATAQYAVDYARGKFVFCTGSGVTASATTLTLQYSYSTNVTFTQLNFGAAGYPGGIQAHDYYDVILERNDRIVAARSQYPVFARPDMVLGTEVAMTPLKQASLFYKFLSPNGTELGVTSDRTFARRDGIVYAQTNAPSILDNQTMLLFVRGMVKYGVDTPFQIDGPHPSYDASTGNLKNEALYKGQEIYTIASPHARDVSTGAVLNAKITKHITY